MAGENWTFWLNMTNFALGIMALLAVLVVAGAVGWDLFFMWLHKVRTGDAVDMSRVNMQRLMAEVRSGWGADDHSLPVPGLGLTMADGAKKSTPPTRTQTSSPHGSDLWAAHFSRKVVHDIVTRLWYGS